MKNLEINPNCVRKLICVDLIDDTLCFEELSYDYVAPNIHFCTCASNTFTLLIPAIQHQCS